jgi:hypothetical protein
MTDTSVLRPPATAKSRALRPVVAGIAVIILIAVLTLAFMIGRASTPTHHLASVSVVNGHGSAPDPCLVTRARHFC